MDGRAIWVCTVSVSKTVDKIVETVVSEES